MFLEVCVCVSGSRALGVPLGVTRCVCARVSWLWLPVRSSPSPHCAGERCDGKGAGWKSPLPVTRTGLPANQRTVELCVRASQL